MEKKTLIGTSGILVGLGALFGITQNDISTLINKTEIAISAVVIVIGIIHKIKKSFK